MGGKIYTRKSNRLDMQDGNLKNTRKFLIRYVPIHEMYTNEQSDVRLFPYLWNL